MVTNDQEESLAVDDDITAGSSSSLSSSTSSEESSSYFEKPLRTFSEDTVITPLANDTKDQSTLIKADSSLEQEEEEEINIIHHPTAPIHTPPIDGSKMYLERKLSHKLSSVSFSDMNDVSLAEEEEDLQISVNEKKEEEYNPLKIITSALVSGKKLPQRKPVPVPTKTFRSSSNNTTSNTTTATTTTTTTTTTVPVPPSKDILFESIPSPLTVASSLPCRNSTDNESIQSTSSTATTSRSIFALWSPFRSSSSTNTSPASSRRPSKQSSAPTIMATPPPPPPTTSAAPRPSASFAARQNRLSRPTSIISPLPGFQEALLAQMEQLNASNTSDPKSKVIKNLKRQSIRHSLVTQNKGDDYDWGKFFTSSNVLRDDV